MGDKIIVGRTENGSEGIYLHTTGFEDKNLKKKSLLSEEVGQDIYTQCSIKDGHYHHLDLLNKARKYGSIERLIKEENITSGLIHSCIKNNVPIALGGSIRDDGPLYFYTVDTSEFTVNKLKDRGSLSVRTMISNAQDFLQRLADNL